MKLSSIRKLLDQEISTEDFLKEIDEELGEFKRQLKKKGASASVCLREDVEFLFKKADLTKLCDLYVANKIDESQVIYIAEAILMASNVTFEPNVADDLYFICAPTDDTSNFKKNFELLIQKLYSF